MTDKTDREIMQQALEALYSAPLDHNSIESRFFERRHYAIIALRERLAQPDQEPVAVIKRNEAGQITMQTPDGNPFDMSKYIGANLYTGPLKQEPVAWLSTDSIGERYLPTPPQKREWQGLTDEEISEINKSIPDGTDLWVAKRVFAREIEAKLKEKNT